MFQTSFHISPLPSKLTMSSSCLFVGSCFSEHIASKLQTQKFKILNNPFGIIYNPISIADSLHAIMQKKKFTDKDIFSENGIYKSFDFHSRISAMDKNSMIAMMNTGVDQVNVFLKSATHLFITLGTSRAYQLNKTGRIVANNHKQPATLFQKLQLSKNDILPVLSELTQALQAFNSKLQIIYTVSPVRHLKDGAVENMLSKSILIDCVHSLLHQFPELYYFPSYELMMDDLRDYRFYAKDMIHPNETAIDYIYSKFSSSCIENNLSELLKTIDDIQTAKLHRPFFPQSDDHKLFLKSMLAKVIQLQLENPDIDFSEEINYFSA